MGVAETKINTLYALDRGYFSDQDEEAGSLVVPDSLKTTEQDQKSESGSSVIIGIIIAVLAVIAAAGVFIYRRGKLYSHMTNMIKQKV